ncbi:unnamed protein product, partial [Mesorhabditis spiculigera]
MAKLLLALLALVAVALATDDCPAVYGGTCSSGPASGANGDECDVGECRHLDEGGFLYECFCSNCDADTNTCKTTAAPTAAAGATTKAGATAATTKAAAATTKAVVTVKTTAKAVATTKRGTSCGTDNSNCATWVSNGFCTSTGYTAAQKFEYCPNYCGQCGATTKTTAKVTVKPTTKKVTVKATVKTTAKPTTAKAKVCPADSNAK